MAKKVSKQIKETFKIKPTPINKKHNQVRNANALGLGKDAVNKYYKEYKDLGGKRSLKQLLSTRPIRADK